MTRSRFSRPAGQVAGPFPEQGALQALLGLRLMSGCHDPFGDDEGRGPPLVATLFWATIAPSFHAWSELGLVRTERDGVLVGHRLGMIVGGARDADARVDLAPGELEEPRFEAPPLWPREPEGAMLDGCSYSLTFAGAASTSTVGFQASTERYRAWARRLHALAELLAARAARPALREYLEVWRSYLV